MSPSATYRLQLRPGFGFDEAAALVDYLADLGISHVYFSPYLQAAAGSTHGYDIVDHTRVNEQLGGAEAHARLCAALRRRGLGQVVDVVPNHMSVASAENRWWWNLLEHGRSSRFASYFDIHWDVEDRQLQGKVLLPILGNALASLLKAGEIRLSLERTTFVVRVYDRTLPVALPSLAPLLAEAARRCGSAELGSLAGALEETADVGSGESLRESLNKVLLERSVAQTINGLLEETNRDAQALAAVLDRQHYRLEYWRTARHELNYRRFFDINELVSLRVEDEQVFRDTHVLVLDWLRQGVVEGVRVDHPDGLRDPRAYFERLRSEAPQAWIVAEKILEPEERLPECWPIDGTTGYDFLNLVGGLFVDARAEPALTRLYSEFTGESAEDFPSLVRAAKRQMLDELFAPDLERLAGKLHEYCGRRRHGDFARQSLSVALKAVIAALPIYRTYLRPGETVRAADADAIGQAMQQASLDGDELDARLLSFLRELLTGRIEDPAAWDVVQSFQQLSGPAMAKGLEDTALYRYHRLLSLNEVGGDPGRFGVSVAEFHRYCAELQQRWPATMLATSTHDTKRSEDVRSRICMLTQMPEKWAEAVKRWSSLANSYRTGHWPDRPTEYLFWQTLVGTWPISLQRVKGYLQKAIREAKLHTCWTAVNQEYEEAVSSFAERVLADPRLGSELEAFVLQLEQPARHTSLAQLLLKLTAPGVPDTYQGSELWDLSLVDPDNRRPVDFPRRQRLLTELAGLACSEVLAREGDGLPKLFLLQRALGLRQQRPECFGRNGEYRPLEVTGTHADKIVAFARGGSIITVVPRLLLTVGDGWGNTAVILPPGRFESALGGGAPVAGTVLVDELVREFPVALLQETVSS